MLITVGAALAYSIAGSGNVPLTSGLNDIAWVGMVMASFPAAMLIMAGSFGLWLSQMVISAARSAGAASAGFRPGP